MTFLSKPNSPEVIKEQLQREKLANAIRDYDQYGETFYFQRCHIDAHRDLNDAMFKAGRIDQRAYNLRQGAIDNLASKCFKQFVSALEANYMLYQLRAMSAQINDQIEKEAVND